MLYEVFNEVKGFVVGVVVVGFFRYVGFFVVYDVEEIREVFVIIRVRVV